MSMLFPSGGLPAGPPIQEGKALLLVDFQNDFVSPEGKLPVANAKAFLTQIPVLASKFRTKGTVIWCRTEYKLPRQTYISEFGTNGILLEECAQSVEDKATSPDYRASRRQRPGSRQDSFHSAAQDPEAFLAKQTKADGGRPCMPGTPGVQYPELIAEAIDTTNDIDVVKSHYSAFADTTLLLSLRMKLITHLYVCGSLSNISVYATVLDAVRHGIQITLVEDLLGYITERCHIEAIRQMVDRMGAMGIDFQELMDDLAGLLGDVIHESDFGSHFQVSISSAPRSHDGRPSRDRITPQAAEQQEREEGRRKEVRPHDSHLSRGARETGRTPQKIKRESPSAVDDSSRSHKSTRMSSPQGTPQMNPLGEGSTSDLEDINGVAIAKSPRQQSSPRPSLLQIESAEGPQVRISKPRVRRAQTSQETSSNPRNRGLPIEHLQSTGKLPDKGLSTMAPAEALDLSSNPTPSLLQDRNKPASTGSKRKLRGSAAPLLGAGDDIGAGDSTLHIALLDPAFADRCFTDLRNQVQWQRMYHRGGEVPRLVAVQGEATPDGDIPIYRHPADESPELLPFDETVQKIRTAAEEVVGHPLNHVLIQWYRSGEDSISEHSDKSLDIVRGSKIVNVSFGARRTMTLRTKRAPDNKSDAFADATNDATAAAALVVENKRESQRIHLPHNSIFILGPVTNQFWLHSIRPDKRLRSERDADEVAFDGERISLTFRHIGTFINSQEGTILGQGATGKTREQRKQLLDGEAAKREGEKMIVGFGRENHQSEDWDWDRTYGQGWDVVNYETKKQQTEPAATH
ncbi:hypothetical protein DV736_g839, partial [Chaetothyriales sp. CBS 134916]